MTLAGQRGSSVTNLISTIGVSNQVRDEPKKLMLKIVSKILLELVRTVRYKQWVRSFITHGFSSYYIKIVSIMTNFVQTPSD